MTTQVLIGDRSGSVIDEVTPLIGPVPWRLNDIDKTTLTFSKEDDKATEANLQYGNRVFIRFSEDIGLPDWGGVIDVPMTWTESTVEASVYGIEYLLQFRQTDKTRAFKQALVGMIFKQLLIETQYDQGLGITYGRIWRGGRKHDQRYHYKKLWEVFKDSLIELENCDIVFVPQLNSGVITFRARLYEKLGSDLSGKYVFKEGMNVTKARVVEQGPIINMFAAIGAGSTWGSKRPVSKFYASASDQLYGLREDSKIYSDVTRQTTLDRYAQTELEETSWPRTRLELEVANKDPATFVRYRLGDTLRCILPSYTFNGYDQNVRVLTREYNPLTKVCRLVVEEEKTTSSTYRGEGVVQA